LKLKRLKFQQLRLVGLMGDGNVEREKKNMGKISEPKAQQERRSSPLRRVEEVTEAQTIFFLLSTTARIKKYPYFSTLITKFSHEKNPNRFAKSVSAFKRFQLVRNEKTSTSMIASE